MTRPLPTVNVLGPVRLRRDDNDVAIRSRNQRVVLALLAVAQGQGVRTDVLAEALWGDEQPADARAAVHTVVSRLRSTLRPVARVDNVPDGYRLSDATSTDVGWFDTLVARAGEAPPGEQADLLRDALALWHGEPLEDLVDVPMLAADRERLAERRQHAREVLGEALLELQRYEELLEVLAPASIADRLSERAVTLRARASYALGRHVEALDVVRAHRRELADELGLDASPSMDELESAILTHDMAAVAPTSRPSPVAPHAAVWQPSGTRFVGRAREVDRLADLAESRCTVVTGPGGVGKTRLVAEWARHLATGEHLAFVGLLGVAPGDVDLAVAVALGLRTDDRQVRSAIVDYLSPEPTLLVIDNCEHVLEEVRSLVADLLRRTAHTRVVATSRSRLGLPHERLLPLSPLPLPDTGDHPATQLFLDRLVALRPEAVEGQEVTAAIEVCRRLDGLPLALELAATRAATLGVAGLRDRLDDVLDLLDDSLDRPGPRGLRGMLDWSYRLLATEAQELLRTMSVFEGPVSLDSVEVVAGRHGTARHLAELVDLGLVAIVPGDPVAYRLLDVVRRFARERLEQYGAVADARDAHARWAIDHARTAADMATGPADAAVFAELARHRTDLLAALRWTLDTDLARAATLAGHLARVSPFRTDIDLLAWARRVADTAGVADVPDGDLVRAAAARAAALAGDVDWAEATAATVRPDADPVVGYLVQHALGIVRLYRNDPVGALAAAEAGLAIGGLAPAHQVDFHVTAALVTAYAGEPERARGHSVAAAALAEASGALAYRAIAAFVDGERVVLQDPEAAIPALRRAVELADTVDAPFVWGIASTSLASALVRSGEAAEARTLMAGVLRHWRQSRSWPQLWTAVRLTAEMLSAAGEHESALVLLEAADHGHGATPVSGPDVARHAGIRARAEQALDHTARLRVRALASALTPAQVVERALVATGEVAPA